MDTFAGYNVYHGCHVTCFISLAHCVFRYVIKCIFESYRLDAVSVLFTNFSLPFSLFLSLFLSPLATPRLSEGRFTVGLYTAALIQSSRMKRVTNDKNKIK